MFFFLKNGKYYFRNEPLKLTRCDKQTIKPLKCIFKEKKVKKTWKKNRSNLKPLYFGANMIFTDL